MIVTCEQCHARYSVAALKLGDTGRTVRCGVCSHTWFQPPIDKDSSAPSSSFQDYMDPIPAGVRPVPEGSAMPSTVLPAKKLPAVDRETITGTAAAAIIFLVVFSGLVLFHKPLVNAWPPFTKLFSLLGLDSSIAGDGLTLEHITAKSEQAADGKSRLLIAGEVNNTLKTETEIPALDIRIGGAHILLKLKKNSLAGESTLPFTATYENVGDDSKDVTIGFAAE